MRHIYRDANEKLLRISKGPRPTQEKGQLLLIISLGLATYLSKEGMVPTIVPFKSSINKVLCDYAQSNEYHCQG